MKNLKKVLALVLAFAMVMTMFASAATYTDVSSDSQYFNAVTLLSDLGIVTGYTDGTYGPEQTITRAEACALVARMLTGKTDVAEYKGASNFTDVAKDYWGESAIGYCVVNNIVVGDGDGKFRPDDAVTQAEFVTMVTRGLGYETTSSPLSYPYGYISAAQDNGVLKDVTIVPSEPALRGMDAVIIYNAIFAEYPKMATYKYVNGVYTQDIPTVAEYVYNIVSYGEFLADEDGYWYDSNGTRFTTDKDTTFVISGKSIDVENEINANMIETSGNSYTTLSANIRLDCDLSKEQIDAVKHYEVKLYYNTDDKKIVAVEVLDSQASYEISSVTYEDTSAKKTDDGEVLIDGKKFQIQKNALYVEIGSATDSEKDYSSLEEVLDGTKNGDIYTLYDWNGDRDIDYVTVSTRVYGYVASYTEGKKISFVLDAHKDTLAGTPVTRLTNTDQTGLLNASIDLTDDSENYVWDIAEGVGEGSVVEIDVSREYSSEIKDTLATYTVTPVEVLSDVQLTAVGNSNAEANNDGKKADYYFDGTKYKSANYRVASTGDEDEETELWSAHQKKLGDSFNVYLDRNGYIVYLQAVDSSFDDYMLILNHNDGAYSSDMNKGNPKVYALLDTNTYKTLTVSEDVDTTYVSKLNDKNEYVDDTDKAMYDEDTGFAANNNGNVVIYADSTKYTTGNKAEDKVAMNATNAQAYVNGSNTTVANDADYVTGALVGYNLDSSGQISDWSFVGNSYKQVRGDDDHAIAADSHVVAYDDDTYKITIGDANGKTTNYVLTDETKVFLYQPRAMGETGTNADDYSKVVTASELAEIKTNEASKYNSTSNAWEAGSTYGDITVAAVTMSGSSNSSTIEAIALQVGSDYYTIAGGDKYPALITGVVQSVVSGSDSKYDFTITAWVNGEKKELKTEQMSNSNFRSNVLGDSFSSASKFSTASDLENRLAYITLNSNDVVTKIEAAVDSNALAGKDSNNGNTVGNTATRAIIVSKRGTSGLSFIPYTGTTTGWSWDTASYGITAINTAAKTARTNYAPYDTDVEFYSINVRPNKVVDSKTGKILDDQLSGSVKKGPDGSYKVTSATASDILVSTISDNIDSNVYYVADLFFNKDGDITAVFMYDQDVSVKASDSSSSSSNQDNDPAKKITTTNNGGTGTYTDPYAYSQTGAPAGATVANAIEAAGLSKSQVAELGSDVYNVRYDQTNISMNTRLDDSAVKVWASNPTLYASLSLLVADDPTPATQNYSFWVKTTGGKYYHITGKVEVEASDDNSSDDSSSSDDEASADSTEKTEYTSAKSDVDDAANTYNTDQSNLSDLVAKVNTYNTKAATYAATTEGQSAGVTYYTLAVKNGTLEIVNNAAADPSTTYDATAWTIDYTVKLGDEAAATVTTGSVTAGDKIVVTAASAKSITSTVDQSESAYTSASEFETTDLGGKTVKFVITEDDKITVTIELTVNVNAASVP